jgi:hypothetical protein
VRRDVRAELLGERASSAAGRLAPGACLAPGARLAAAGFPGDRSPRCRCNLGRLCGVDLPRRRRSPGRVAATAAAIRGRPLLAAGAGAATGTPPPRAAVAASRAARRTKTARSWANASVLVRISSSLLVGMAGGIARHPGLCQRPMAGFHRRRAGRAASHRERHPRSSTSTPRLRSNASTSRPVVHDVGSNTLTPSG